MILYPIEGKYNNNEKFDISIVIPMYNSKEVVADQIERWAVTDKGLKVEIIYVDDKCPQHSSQAVMLGWNKRRDKKDFNVKLLLNPQNKGFGEACNAGAHHASGKYIIFLNADTIVTPNWLYPIFEVFENDTKVGIVGNLQLKEGGEWHGTIDSAGSEWTWDETNFVHIGRHILQGKPLEEPLKRGDLPDDAPTEREMVTGCCLAIRRDLFVEIGGFNQHYRIGYWEDSEINMCVKDMGYKVVFQPNSVIWHKLSHSKVGLHPYHDTNKQYFMNKWEASGRFDPFIKAPRPLKRAKVNRILVRRAAANGDVLLAAGVVPALKKKYPEAVVDFTTCCESVLYGNPHIDNVIDEVTVFNNLHRYQLVINLDGAYERRPNTSVIKAYADEAGIPISDMEYYIHQEPCSKPLPSDYIVMHAGYTNWVGRNWSTSNFEQIAQKLLDEGQQVICIGRGDDRFVPSTMDLRSRISIYELANVVKNAKFYIGIDSMPMHIAQCLNIPGICFFGSISPELRLFRENMTGLTAPNLSCLGCHHRRLAPCTTLQTCETGTLDCESKLTVNLAWQKIKEKLCNQSI